MPRQCIFLMLENAALLLMSQSSLIIQQFDNGTRDPTDGHKRDTAKQVFIRDVASELETFITSISRYFHRTGISIPPLNSSKGGPQSSPGSQLFGSDSQGCAKSDLGSSGTSSRNYASSNVELTVYYIVELFLNRCLKNSSSG